MNGSTTLLGGNKGGGKTLYSVEEMIEHIKLGGYVFTNVLLKHDKIREFLANDGYVYDEKRVTILGGADMAEFYRHVGRGTHDMPVMVVFDEAAVAGLNARDYRDLERDMFNFNVLVRKLDIRLIYIAQQPEFLDKQIRKLCDYFIDCRNMRHFRIFGVIPLPIPLLVRVNHVLIGGRFSKTGSDVVTSRKHLYPLYDSDALLGDAAAKFCTLGVLKASALQRIERSDSDILPYIIATICAALVVSF